MKPKNNFSLGFGFIMAATKPIKAANQGQEVRNRTTFLNNILQNQGRKKCDAKAHGYLPSNTANALFRLYKSIEK